MKFLKIILFLPHKIKQRCQFEIFGEIDEEEKGVAVFYGFDCDTKCKGHTRTECIARCINKYIPGDASESTRNSLTLSKTAESQYSIRKLSLKNEDFTATIKDVLIFFYDEISFTREFYKKEASYFMKLQEKLIKHQKTNRRQSESWGFLTQASKTGIDGLKKCHFVLKYSSIAMQMKTTAERLHWAMEKRNSEGIKITNLILCLIFDVLLGALSINFVLSFVSAKYFPDLFLFAAENCVNSLRESLEWLMGSPAGFKLNREFNAVLTKFYLFHTDIWWLFLVYISPILGVAFKIFIFLGWLGLTFQAAILSDILGLVSFHAYCIYAYAARLYNLQLSGLRSLWRLFFGRKWNPLREKVDSCQFTADQLFVGTLVFTVLLFLLPTTLIYYVVFTLVRLLLVAMGGILSRVRLYLHAVPLYSLLLWCFGSSKISTQVYIEVEKSMSSENVTVLNVRRVRGPLLPTLRNGIADCIDTLPPLLPEGFLRVILTGELLYPV